MRWAPAPDLGSRGGPNLHGKQGVGARRLRAAEGGAWIGPSKQAPTQGRAHGGQVRAQKGSTGKFRFNLAAPNGQVIATSEAYESKASAIKGIESVKRNAPNAEIDDQTDK